jgi:hypothetical protein
MSRKALDPFAFPDGTIIPTGAFVAAAARPENTCAAPNGFDGFRYAKTREGGSNEAPDGLP